jgi:hypothetical protein
MFQAEATIAPHHVVLIAIGSSGDVHPFIGLGLARRAGASLWPPINVILRAGGAACWPSAASSLGTLEVWAALGNPGWHPAG